MDEDIKKLKEACFRVAQGTLWDMKPVSLEVIQQHADRLFEEAKIQYEIIEGLGGSIPLVTRAVCYIEQAHAIPPIKNDVRWFRDTLRAVLEVACPNTGLQGEAREFLIDMLKGISTFIKVS